jgi:hypothetical protein
LGGMVIHRLFFSYALDLVDSIVFFQVLCPKIKKVAGVDNLINISTELGNELIEVYKNKIYWNKFKY